MRQNEDLYFFTTLSFKGKAKGSCGSRISRTISFGGTWSNEGSKIIYDTHNSLPIGMKCWFHYENSQSPQNGYWIMHKFTLDVDGSSLLLPPLYCAAYVEMIKPRPLLGRGKFSHNPCLCSYPNKIVQERSSRLLLMHLTTLFCNLFLFLTNILTFTFMALLLLSHLSKHFQPWLLFLILFQNQNLGMRGRLNLNLIQP